jgi:hypothetical protein
VYSSSVSTIPLSSKLYLTQHPSVTLPFDAIQTCFWQCRNVGLKEVSIIYYFIFQRKSIIVWVINSETPHCIQCFLCFLIYRKLIDVNFFYVLRKTLLIVFWRDRRVNILLIIKWRKSFTPKIYIICAVASTLP